MTTADRISTALAGRYRVEREIGVGGMAAVFLAHDEKHDREVAIKVLHPDLGAALGGERFLAEIKTTAKLQHPHILPLLDSGEADALLYYVMPFVAGETLRARLERERQLPIDDALRIAREVADALGAAHTLGIVHRDIKPENILLQSGHALVADFGIALAVQQARGARMTQTGLSLGTPQYMSPEQAMGDRNVDARADIYALGAVTYEMLTGEPPFTGASVQAIVAKVMNAEPEAPTLDSQDDPARRRGSRASRAREAAGGPTVDRRRVRDRFDGHGDGNVVASNRTGSFRDCTSLAGRRRVGAHRRHICARRVVAPSDADASRRSLRAAGRFHARRQYDAASRFARRSGGGVFDERRSDTGHSPSLARPRRGRGHP